MKIFTILYNTGKGADEVPFEEKRINLNDLVIVKDSDLSDTALLAKVSHVPVCMMAS